MSDVVKENGFYKIRPAARIIQTIGSDLIGDPYAALIELVKNSYDADSPKVDIDFEYKSIGNRPALVITIVDEGHGMSFDTFINKWLVPGTNDKLVRKISPSKKRPLQGRKGIGRFAASILGQEMTLVSVNTENEQTSAVIDWRIFQQEGYLDDVQLLVEKEYKNQHSGTSLQIVAFDEGDDTKLSYWDEVTIEALINELRRLISPFEELENDKFDINLTFKNSPYPQLNNGTIKIETYPIIKFYDYRISGTINENGEANLVFENNISPDSKQSEIIKTKFSLDNNVGKFCGLIKLDYRVYDREPEAIANLINKGLIKRISEDYIRKNLAKQLLNEAYGVNIYKNSFRIRPYGNGGIDWLDLDKDRIQNFTLRISNNQIIGFVFIQSEELSHLEEKSARDGLKENEYYFGLKELAKKALAELETRRLTYRIKSDKSRNQHKNLNSKVNELFSLSELKNNISSTLKKLKVAPESINEIDKILTKEEADKYKLKEEIEQTIAIYQGQATLGKIINLVLHEGRKPIQFFNSETTVIERYIRHYQETKDEKVLKELDYSINGFRNNSKTITNLFKRITPLANQRRNAKTDFQLANALRESIQIFQLDLEESAITIDINCPSALTLYGWKEDLITALTNLIENSIYWLKNSNIPNKCVSIHASSIDNTILVDFKDNGPGLSDTEIESEIIFEPGYTKKLNGTGLGLAISGEAINRLNGKLSAMKDSGGAYFQMEFQKA